MPRKAPLLALTLAVTVAIAAIVAGATLGRRSKGSKEMEQYLEERRQARMSEEAETTLKRLADLEAGWEVINYIKDPQTSQYGVSYDVAFCPRPGTTRQQIEKIEAPYHKLASEELEILKKIADSDRSGFVTSKEARRLSGLIRFARQAIFVTEQEGHDSVTVAKAMDMDHDFFVRRVKEYRKLLRETAHRDPKMRDLQIQDVPL